MLTSRNCSAVTARAAVLAEKGLGGGLPCPADSCRRAAGRPRVSRLAPILAPRLRTGVGDARQATDLADHAVELACKRAALVGFTLLLRRAEGQIEIVGFKIGHDNAVEGPPEVPELGGKRRADLVQPSEVISSPATRRPKLPVRTR
jgi:hypothetical protein